MFWSALGQEQGPDPIMLATPSTPRASLNAVGEAVLAIAALSFIAGLIGTFYNGFPIPPKVFALIGGTAWIAVSVALDAQPVALRETLQKGGRWLRTRDGGALLLILLLATLLRLNNLDSLPAGLWFDEARIGLEAQRILTDPS